MLSSEKGIVMKYKVFMHQYVEEICEVEVEANSPEEAADKAEEMAREGEVDWSDGDDVVPGAAAQVGRASYRVTANDNEVWVRD